MTDLSIIRRLATSQARGTRQLSLVNELLTFQPVPSPLEQYPVAGGRGAKGYSRNYGDSQLRHSSYVPLRRRLTEVGFILVANKGRTQVTMAFPEG